MQYHFKIHKEKKGYWAECVELKGCVTQADSLDELSEQMKEALNLYLAEPEKSSILFPMPLKNKPRFSGGRVERVEVNPSVAFAMLIRQTRIAHGLTLREMADILNYKNLNTYVKLEKANTSNPQLKTLANIIENFSDFPISLIFKSA